MDIENILLRLEEVEKLKKILLDKEQLYLFNNLPKPVLRPKFKPSNPNKCTKKTNENNNSNAVSVVVENRDQAKNNTMKLSNTEIFEQKKRGKTINLEKLSRAFDNLEGRSNKTNTDKTLIDAYQHFVFE